MTRRDELEGRLPVPEAPRLLVADVQTHAKGETRVDVYQLVAEFKFQAKSLEEAVDFVVGKAQEFAQPNVTIVQPIGVDNHTIELLRRRRLKVNGR